MKIIAFLICVCCVLACAPKTSDLSTSSSAAPKGIDQNTLPIPTIEEIADMYGFEDFDWWQQCIINADSTYSINGFSGDFFIERGHYTHNNRLLVLYADSTCRFGSSDFVQNNKPAENQTQKWIFCGFGNTTTLSKNVKWANCDNQSTYLYDRSSLHKTTSTNKQERLYPNASHFDKNPQKQFGVWVLVEK
jgi:hypothetical protein